MIEISIIIVNYKTPILTDQCIQSIFANCKLNIEIIIVDNDSQDNSKELILSKYPTVKWIDVGYNSGFAKANNIGIKSAIGQYVLLLNSDTVLKENTIEKVYNYYKLLVQAKSNPGLITCKLIGSDNDLQYNSFKNFPTIVELIKKNALYIYFTRFITSSKDIKLSKKVKQHSTNHKTKWIWGTFVFCDRKIFTEFNLLLDEDFFMYCEDIEWSKRTIKKGFKNYYFSETQVIHLCSASASSSRWKQRQMAISEMLYFFKVKGCLIFRIYSWLSQFNLWLDYQLEKRKNKECQEIIFNIKLIKRYRSIILREYKRRPSSSNQQLKYIMDV